MTINSRVFLRRVEEAFLLKKINKKTATHFKTVYNKFDTKKNLQQMIRQMSYC